MFNEVMRGSERFERLLQSKVSWSIMKVTKR
jgi:hypothetical protein